MSPPVHVVGGYQTDFADHWSRRGKTLFDLMEAAVKGALSETGLAPGDIEAAHIGNFTGELFSGQGQLGGLFVEIDPAFAGLPTARHEAACASGSVALLAAAAGIRAGDYDVACVVGVEQMRCVPGRVAADHLAAACWRGREAEEATYAWPHLFSELATEYDRRYRLDRRHLAAIAELNFANARRNPNAQTRTWQFGEQSFTDDDEANPVVEGVLRRHDCAQITDGAAALILCSQRFAERYQHQLARLAGWGHRTAPMRLADKLSSAAPDDYLFPHLVRTVEDARRRAGLEDVGDIDAFELHDCFTITEYMLLEHIGLAAPGKGWMPIEEQVIEPGGKSPVNPSGGLIGAGHPVGATGVRMALDAALQVAGKAGDYQVDGARRAQTVNIGGSATTTVSFVLER